MPKKYLLSASLLFGIALTSCQQMQFIDRAFDANEKTISVPTGYRDITGNLKLGLKRQGWTLHTNEGTTSKNADNTKTIQYAGYGRYRMSVETGERYFDFFTLSTRVRTVTCSVIDNNNNQEIFCYEATNVRPSGAVNRILKLIQENTK